jgi:hypothetical protein
MGRRSSCDLPFGQRRRRWPSQFTPRPLAAARGAAGGEWQGAAGPRHHRRPLRNTCLGAPRSGGLVSGRLRGHLIVWGSRTAPPPLESGGRNRPLSPHPKASPPRRYCAGGGAGRPAEWSTIVRARGALLDGAEGADVVPTARLGQPRRAVRRLRHGFRAGGPTSDGMRAADLRTTVHPVFPIRCGECMSDFGPTALALAPSQCALPPLPSRCVSEKRRKAPAPTPPAGSARTQARGGPRGGEQPAPSSARARRLPQRPSSSPRSR